MTRISYSYEVGDKVIQIVDGRMVKSLILKRDFVDGWDVYLTDQSKRWEHIEKGNKIKE